VSSGPSACPGFQQPMISAQTCLPTGPPSCPQTTACLYNGINYFCCPMQGSNRPSYGGGALNPPGYAPSRVIDVLSPPTLPGQPCSPQTTDGGCSAPSGPTGYGNAGGQTLPVFPAAPYGPSGCGSPFGCGGGSPTPSQPSSYGSPAGYGSGSSSYPRPNPTPPCGSNGCQSPPNLPLFLGPLDSQSSGCGVQPGDGCANPPPNPCYDPSTGSEGCKLIGGSAADSSCPGGVLTATGCYIYTEPQPKYGYGAVPAPSPGYGSGGTGQKISGHVKPQPLIYPVPDCCPENQPASSCTFPCTQTQSLYMPAPNAYANQPAGYQGSGNSQPLGYQGLGSPQPGGYQSAQPVQPTWGGSDGTRSNMPPTYNEAHGLQPSVASVYPSGPGWGFPQNRPATDSVTAATLSPDQNSPSPPSIQPSASTIDQLPTTDATSGASADLPIPTAPTLKRLLLKDKTRKPAQKSAVVKKLRKPTRPFNQSQDSFAEKMLRFSDQSDLDNF